jgi:hypothetical protein
MATDSLIIIKLSATENSAENVRRAPWFRVVAIEAICRS